MTYIELLNSFWDSTRFNPCSSNEATMYFYLLHQCNIRRWINPFEFNTRDLELTLGFTRATISAIRNKLKQRGLIDFSKGIGSGSAVYLICDAKVTDKKLSERICVQPLNTTLNTTLNTNANPTLYIEEKRNKTKDKNVADATCKDARPPFPEIIFPKEKKREKSRNSTKDLKPVPTLEEVKRYFLSVDADKRLNDWENVAMKFYDYFAAVDWRDRYNRHITRWDSRANSWIADEELRQGKSSAGEHQKINGARKQEDIERLRQVPEQIDARRFRPPKGYSPLTWYNELKSRAAAGDKEAIALLSQQDN